MRNETTKVKTINVDGEDIDIFIDSDDGRFHARLDGQDVYQPNLKQLEAKLREQSRQKRRLNIEGTLLGDRWNSDGIAFEDIVIIGKHGGNDNLLYRGPEEKGTRQMRSYGDGDLMRRLTKEEREQIKGLEKARTDANKAIELWKKKHKLDVAKAIKAQLADKPDAKEQTNA